MITPRRRPLRLFGALPPYLGSKRRLAPLIFALVDEILPRDHWRDATLLDPFSGGGAIALYAKALGFNVVASDIAERAYVVACALVANPDVRLRREDLLSTFDPQLAASGPLDELDSPLMSAGRTAWIHRGMAAAERVGEPRRSLLRLLVLRGLLRSFPMSMPSASDAAAAAAGDYDRISPRRLGHYLRVANAPTLAELSRTAEAINAGVFAGRGRALRGDAREVIAATDADLVYLDPPYASTTRYEQAYALVDRLLGDEAPDAISPPELDELLDAARQIPRLVLSYGGPTTTLEALTEQVARHRRVHRTLAVPYAHLRAVATKEHARDNREFVIVA